MTIIKQALQALMVGPEENRMREPLNVLGEPGLVKLAGEDTDNAMAVIHLAAPKLSGPPLHRHSREDEWFYVLDGELTFELEGRRFIARAGASTFAPRGTVHTYQNFNQETAHLLVMVAPAGLDRFFDEVTALNTGLAQPDFAGVERLMQNYGMELLGPPLA